MALEHAYELGRRAIAEGFGMLDIAAVHQGALSLVLQRTPQESTETMKKAGQFFAESIAPFEMAFRGFQESITRLHDLNRTLEQSELKFRSVVQTANDAIISGDSNGNIISWNKRAQTIFDYAEEEVLGKPLTILMPEKYKDALSRELKRFRSTGESEYHGKTLEFKGLRKEGSEFPIEISIATWKTEKGLFFTGIVRDISERKRAEEELKESLKEKEVLLKEVHHRVKNNMQVISSLLMLQEDSSEDKKIIEMLKDSQNRISSMALIHERLYRSHNLSKVDLNEYIDDLVSGLFQSYGVSESRVALNINVENVLLGIDSAIPCGLIINELVSNSLKHAFPGDKNGEIKIFLRLMDENMIELVVGDNGIGIPEDMDIRKTRSLGLYLVTLLVENQLHGEIALNRERGTEFLIKFRGMK